MSNEEEEVNPYVLGFFGVVIGLLLLWVGGWGIAWSEYIHTTKAIYINHGVAIEFNSRYYGLTFEDRWFDSPVVSWVLGLAGIVAIGSAVNEAAELLGEEPSGDSDLD